MDWQRPSFVREARTGVRRYAAADLAEPDIADLFERERIEERAIKKFQDTELEGNLPGVILRSIDFRK